MAKPIIAIVGRPNVGKSTLFNKLVGQRLSIVKDTPGVTRDRIYSPCEWRGKEVMLVDTGGIEPYSNDVILSQMRRQAQLAIDKRRCHRPGDRSAHRRYRQRPGSSQHAAQERQAGGALCQQGGYHRRSSAGILRILQPGSGRSHCLSPRYMAMAPATCWMPATTSSILKTGRSTTRTYIKVAIIGKPNVGKSSLVNRMTGQERAIVSNIAGTTRDATDSILENEHGKYVLIDTAGIRRKSRVDDDIEKYSVLRAYMAVDRADVCLIVIDATEGFTEQDSKVAGYAHEQGKASIVVINKWDAVEKDGKTMDEYRKKLENDFSFMSYVPFIFISALTGQRVDKLYDLINYVCNQNARRISTGMLNDMLAYATARVQPPSDKGKRLRLFYITQASTKPPAFVIFCNSLELFHFSYQRYLENQIRETFGLDGTPIRIIPRERGRDNK